MQTDVAGTCVFAPLSPTAPRSHGIELRCVWSQVVLLLWITLHVNQHYKNCKICTDIKSDNVLVDFNGDVKLGKALMFVRGRVVRCPAI